MGVVVHHGMQMTPSQTWAWSPKSELHLTVPSPGRDRDTQILRMFSLTRCDAAPICALFNVVESLNCYFRALFLVSQRGAAVAQMVSYFLQKDRTRLTCKRCSGCPDGVLFSSERQNTTDLQDVCRSLSVPERAIFIYFTGRTDIDGDKQINSHLRSLQKSPLSGWRN
ncbi:uncharacterized protein LOC124667669 isoform X2 [Lolium rigidum]|uniref:uncharacterized protein LOC124667669 isoform X2 n=1 Tax=Lolium rigidum TaxID=89674 RepID=UPI001F5D4F53|nr:uncharacterized protein LOC124667669 isoform X2 [Lolium rigidum]XP_047060886.1 uncharacterized protein LOC124667669 isoform X2 [Lolium rigidum]